MLQSPARLIALGLVSATAMLCATPAQASVVSTLPDTVVEIVQEVVETPSVPPVCTACIADLPDLRSVVDEVREVITQPAPTVPPVPSPCTACIADLPDLRSVVDEVREVITQPAPTVPPVPVPTVPPVDVPPVPTLPPVPAPTVPPLGVPPVPTVPPILEPDEADGARGTFLDPTYVPAAPTSEEAAALLDKAQVQAQAEPLDTAMLASAATGSSVTDSDQVVEFDSCPENPCGGGSSAPASAKVRIGFNAQETNYYCAPATTQNLLYGIRGVRFSQDDLAVHLRTRHPNPSTGDLGGTDPRRIAPLLNSNQTRNRYQALTAAEVGSAANLFSRVVTNTYRYRVGTGFTGDPALMPWSANPKTVGKYSHEVAIYGYSSSGGGMLFVSDPWASPYKRQFAPAQAWESMHEDRHSLGILTW